MNTQIFAYIKLNIPSIKQYKKRYNYHNNYQQKQNNKRCHNMTLPGTPHNNIYSLVNIITIKKISISTISL